MRDPGRGSAAALLVLASALVPVPSPATDVNGGNDCLDRGRVERGDAPEGILAYPGVLAAFPSCTSPGPIGTQNIACPPISSAPGPAGFVAHVAVAGEDRYWLGCFAGQGGLDEEGDAKVNAGGAPLSDCSNVVSVDCFETAFGLTFGQDECYGSSDAALAAPVAFTACAPATVSVPVTSCGTASRDVFLNVLVDWNQDGDWNDNFQCGTSCVFEWAVQNVPVTLGPGCTSVTSPGFQAGPAAGNGWMRITISNDPVPLDFPWAGSATMPGQQLFNGETEDYPVTITSPGGGGICPDYEDWGDAPETSTAYGSGLAGAFPTCLALGLVGTVEAVAPILGTPPLAAGFVRHIGRDPDPKFWLGCGAPAQGTQGIDSEPDGKMNASGAATSDCDPLVVVDGVETAFTLSFGRDESLGDPEGDAGLIGPVAFQACATESVSFRVYNCDPAEFVIAYLNVLMDFNRDADWNDNFACGPPAGAPVAHEWCVKNQQVLLPPGCSTMTSQSFLVGPSGGESWMRLTLSLDPVGDDFPWNGSAGGPGGLIVSGETEDYPVTVAGPDTCQVAYEDFGDAPEDVQAYTTGTVGRFPTCLAPGVAGTQTVSCSTSLSPAPGATGHVRHVALANDPEHFWLGCAQAPSALLAVDGEADGKTNLGAPWGGPSACDPVVGTDCAETLIGLGMNQDECVGDVDAALAAPTFFYACSTGSFGYSAFNCGSHDLPAYLNVLVDWSHDGDWNDNVHACGAAGCAPEWAIKNLPVALVPGCQTYQTPVFVTGADPDRSWMRLTLSSEPAADDFPWNGTAGMPSGRFQGGETEDHPINVIVNPVAVESGRPAHGPWLGAPFPNPARGPVGIPFTLAAEGEASLAVYDLAGRRVASLHEGRAAAGPHRVSWDLRDAAGRALAPGHYVLRLRAGGQVLSRVLVRLD
jgi:hypothetical protein